MAKISAYSATEVCRFKVVSLSGSYKMLFVMASDGRVLSRYTDASRYGVFGRVKDPAKRNSEFLRDFLTRRGYEIIEEG